MKKGQAFQVEYKFPFFLTQMRQLELRVTLY